MLKHLFVGFFSLFHLWFQFQLLDDGITHQKKKKTKINDTIFLSEFFICTEIYLLISNRERKK